MRFFESQPVIFDLFQTQPEVITVSFVQHTKLYKAF